MRTSEQITGWLKDKGVYSIFLRNIDILNTSLTFKILVNRRNNIELISDAFRWDNSPEGDLYWRRIDTMYREWYKEGENQGK